MTGSVRDHAEECGLSPEEFCARVEHYTGDPFMSLGGSTVAWTLKLTPEQSARILRKRDPQIFFISVPSH